MFCISVVWRYVTSFERDGLIDIMALLANQIQNLMDTGASYAGLEAWMDIEMAH